MQGRSGRGFCQFFTFDICDTPGPEASGQGYSRGGTTGAFGIDLGHYQVESVRLSHDMPEVSSFPRPDSGDILIPRALLEISKGRNMA